MVHNGTGIHLAIMSELFRTRDCVVHFKGDSYPVAVTPAMITTGWAGGQGVMWADAPDDDFMVTFSDGIYGGFLLWGSDETADQWTGITGSQLKYGYATFCAGGWLLSTLTYEQYTWASRQVGPLVPIIYTPGERLLFSVRGWFTNEDEWTLTVDPRAPNIYYNAYVVQAPRAGNDNYLVLLTSI